MQECWLIFNFLQDHLLVSQEQQYSHKGKSEATKAKWSEYWCFFNQISIQAKSYWTYIG